ncbi:small integral membrane protein 19-like [Megalops cyprinoides]|uniref:small integral membrane protein 19-like n=1 Tax=Megalops cyprinoides TaxID=118141 RepID=UPI001863DDEE|nr:small integral membrane protein 19-like [Megalops cyprinoides]
MGGYGMVSNEETIDYSVHEAWNEATNVYLLVILVSFGLLMYARKNKRKIMRIFTLPPTVGSSPEPNFYDSLQKVRLRQQLEMYSLARKFDQHQQGQAESVQLAIE